MSNDAPVLTSADAGFGMGADARTAIFMMSMTITTLMRGGDG